MVDFIVCFNPTGYRYFLSLLPLIYSVTAISIPMTVMTDPMMNGILRDRLCTASFPNLLVPNIANQNFDPDQAVMLGA